MKRIIIYFTIISMGFFACEKDNNIEKKQVNNKRAGINSDMTELESSIRSFLNNIDDEAEGSLHIDSSIYYLEAGFNYRYSHSGHDNEMSGSFADTSYVDILIGGNDECQYSDLKTTFDDIYSAMDNIFETISNSTKALRIVDIEPVERGNGLELRLISFWSYGNIALPGDWLWGHEQGRCDGTMPGFDAGDAMQRRYELNNLTLPYGIWSNIKTSDKYYALENIMTNNIPQNPYGYYTSLLFATDKYINQPICVLHDEINFYANNLIEAINRIKNEENINKPINGFELIEDQVNVNNNPFPVLYDIQLFYGDFQEVRHFDGSDVFLSN